MSHVQQSQSNHVPLDFSLHSQNTLREVQKAHPRAVADGLYRVQILLDAGHTKEALRILHAQRYHAPAFENARAVCLMRLGMAEDAVRLLSGIALVNEEAGLRNNIPAIYKMNLATALAMTGSVSASCRILDDLDAAGFEHFQITELRVSLQRWQLSLSLWELFQWNLGGSVYRPVSLHYLPGELG